MICLHCSHANLKDKPEYSKLGLARCTHISKKEYGASTFMSLTFKRSCKEFEQASEEIINARDAWNEKRVA